MLKPEESRMYEGFCRLEASAHGKLDELFVFFYTPFEDFRTYSRNILRDWIKEVKTNEKERDLLTGAGIDIANWDYQKYEELIKSNAEVNYNRLLIEFMHSYRQLLQGGNVSIVLSLLPKELKSTGGFSYWMDQFMREDKPSNIRLLVFDHIEANHWGNVFEKFKHGSVTLLHDLRMDEAIKQIATAGDRRNPEVEFRKCLFEMGDAVNKKNLQLLHQWGKKAIDIGTKSGNKSLLATACISYAGMLFSFKEHATIQHLLDRAIRICQREAASGDASIRSILLQCYAFKAAAYQHRKETRNAYEWFMKQGKEACEFGLFALSLSACYKAFLLAQYKNMAEEQITALHSALKNTSHLSLEEIRSTEYPYIAYEYTLLALRKAQGIDAETAVLANEQMRIAFGDEWIEKVELLKQHFNKQAIEIQEARSMVASDVKN
jgi:hypothetical protein